MNSSHPGNTPLSRVLGIDYGERKIGLAVSSEDGKFVFGRGILRTSSVQEVLDHIRHICGEDGITTIIVGMPFAKDGGRGESAHAVEAFVQKLRTAIPLPVVLEDERMTSLLAQRLSHEAGESGKDDDELAAKILVEGYLERNNSSYTPV
ncbi:MAG: Holliday junction resolvase RuvX [Parcubacteria group bacterium]